MLDGWTPDAEHRMLDGWMLDGWMWDTQDTGRRTLNGRTLLGLQVSLQAGLQAAAMVER